MANPQPPNQILAGIDVAVLSGGLGTRLRPAVADLPKILAPVGGRPFFDIMADWLSRFGVRRMVLCLGYKADAVTRHIETVNRKDIEFVPVVEPEPMGTGGAIRHARRFLRTDPIMVVNGDSWVDADLGEFLAFHRRQGSLASLVCVDVDDSSRYGRVEVGDNGMIERFIEKEPGNPRPGLINAGVFLLSQKALDRLEMWETISLERDFLQRLSRGELAGFICRGSAFVDIGTPSSLAEAEHIIEY